MNTTGAYNTALVFKAGNTLDSGDNNICIGGNSDTNDLFTTDSIAIGNTAIAGNCGVAIGGSTNATGTRATALGYSSQANHNNATAIGYNVETRVANETVIRGIRVIRETLKTTDASPEHFNYTFDTLGDIAVFDVYVMSNISQPGGNVAIYTFKDGGVANKGLTDLAFTMPEKITIMEDDSTTDANVVVTGNNLQVFVVGSAVDAAEWTIVINLKTSILS